MKEDFLDFKEEFLDFKEEFLDIKEKFLDLKEMFLEIKEMFLDIKGKDLEEEMEKKLTGTQLKLIAIVSMTTDHLVSVIYPNYPTAWYLVFLHILGRLAAPIFWYMTAEGYHHTKNVKKYLFRLALFSLLGHFAYNFAFGIPFIPFKTSVFNQTSVILPLFLGVLGLCVLDSQKIKQWQKTLLIFLLSLLAFPADWSSPAFLAVIYIGRNRGNFKKQMICMLLWILLYATIYAIFINPLYGAIQMGVLLVIPLLKAYNGERGLAFFGIGSKYFFYWYYPLHLVLCGIIRIALHGNVGVMIGG